MSNKLVLYSCWTSSCSFRARIALALKNLDYELKCINLQKGEQKRQEYLAINPNGMVPTLIHNGKVFSDSMAIIEYLDEKFPQPYKFLPEDSESRAIVRALSYSITTNVQPLHCLRVRNYHGQGNKQKADEWARYWIQIGNEAIERTLEKTAGKYAYGNSLTMADICIPPHVFNARDKFGIDMSSYPTISRLDKNLSGMQEIQGAHPTKQPDCNQ
uniref:maleylacetoacetate isomerase n=1 Tax=Acrobeloides nanus TaxID=290746 RepID=A0A914DYU8_9BILA